MGIYEFAMDRPPGRAAGRDFRRWPLSGMTRDDAYVAHHVDDCPRVLSGRAVGQKVKAGAWPALVVEERRSVRKGEEGHAADRN